MRFSPFNIALITLITVAATYARPVFEPSVARLHADAELVAIVTATSSVTTIDIPDDNSFGGRDVGRYVGIETRFRVEQVLKGDTNLTSLALLHFGYKGPKPDFNGAHFMEFLPQNRTLVVFPQAEVWKPDISRGLPYATAGGTFLAYLRRLPDGRFAPIVPQYDAALAFRLLALPRHAERYRMWDEK